MKKIIVALISALSLFATFFSCAQGIPEKESQFIYFVMAHIDYDNDYYNDWLPASENRGYLKILFRLEQDTLAVVDTLNAKRRLKMDMLYNYPSERILYFSESNLFDYDFGRYLSILDYSDSLVVRRKEVQLKPSHRLNMGYPRMLKLNDTLFFNNEWDKGEDYMKGVSTQIGVDKYFNKRVIKPKDFNHVIVEGCPGMQRRCIAKSATTYIWGNYDSLRIYKTDKKEVRVNRDVTGYPAADIQMPPEMKRPGANHFVVFINNAKHCVGILSEGARQNVKDTLFSALILDKSTNDWHQFSNKNSMSRVMYWEDWLYGTVVLSKKEKPADTSSFELIRHRYDRYFGKPKYLDYFYPGILYLYNIPSRKYIKWETNDPDSEIILIDKGIIYYRIFDEIRRVNLDARKNEINWLSDKLIIRDKTIVPNVHWMFFAPKMDMKEIWVNETEGE